MLHTVYGWMWLAPLSLKSALTLNVPTASFSGCLPNWRVPSTSPVLAPFPCAGIIFRESRLSFLQPVFGSYLLTTS
jgi:hypothetical protein